MTKPDISKIKLRPDFVKANHLGPQGRVAAKTKIATTSALMSGLSDKAKLRLAAKSRAGK